MTAAGPSKHLERANSLNVHFNSLGDAISQATARLHGSERECLELWQPEFPVGGGRLLLTYIQYQGLLIRMIIS